MAKIHWSGGSADLRIGCERERGNRFGSILHRSWSSSVFVERATASPDHYCAHCTKAARLALAAESAPVYMATCTRCRSGAINPNAHGRTEGVDLDLCDVCYWRKRAESAEFPKPQPISEAPKDGCILGWVPATDELRAGWELLHYSVSATEWHDNAGVAHEPTHFLPLPPEVSRDLASTQESHYRTDSERYAELRMLVEDCQREAMDSASPVVMFDNALRLVLDWRHR